MESRALGKGLSALIPSGGNVQADKEESNIFTLDISLIDNNSFQPRADYNGEKLKELEQSIVKHGVLQPILVRKKQDRYEVVAGERRLRACRSLDIKTIPVVVREVTDNDILVLALIENIQREELNPIEEAEAFAKLIDKFGYKQEEIAASVGKNRSTITNFLRLLKLPFGIKESVKVGNITVGHARALLSIDNPLERDRIFVLITKKGLSVRETEALAKKQNLSKSKNINDIKSKPVELLQLEENLQKLLGTKVRINFNKKQGNIVVDYYSLTDLERIVKVFSQYKINT